MGPRLQEVAFPCLLSQGDYLWLSHPPSLTPLTSLTGNGTQVPVHARQGLPSPAFPDSASLFWIRTCHRDFFVSWWDCVNVPTSCLLQSGCSLFGMLGSGRIFWEWLGNEATCLVTVCPALSWEHSSKGEVALLGLPQSSPPTSSLCQDAFPSTRSWGVTTITLSTSLYKLKHTHTDTHRVFKILRIAKDTLNFGIGLPKINIR